MSTGAQAKIADDPNVVTIEQVAEWLGYLLPKDGGTEIRAIFADKRVKSKVFPASTSALKIATHALAVSKRAKTVYYTLNPLRDALGENKTACDEDVIRRHLLLFDLDPKRPANTAASDEEKAAAKAKAVAVRDFLVALGWPEPIIVDSGNGYHLLFLIDLPNNDDSDKLIKAILYAVAARFSDEAVDIDRSVHNASRISKLPGTMTRKGDGAADRPHRVSRLIWAPEKFEPVSRELLENLAAEWIETKAKLRKSRRFVIKATNHGNDKHHGMRAKEEDVRGALDALPSSYATDYQLWLLILMALHAWDLVRGLALAHEFSRRCMEKYDADELDYKWSTFDSGGGVTIGTLFHEAIEHGWTAPWMFKGMKYPRTNGAPHGDEESKSDRVAAIATETVPAPDAPEQTPTDDAPGEAVFANFAWAATGKAKVPLRVGQLDEGRRAILGDWPKRIGGTLFVRGSGDEPLYIESATQFFALVDRHAAVEWAKGERTISQERYFEHLRATAEKFDAIESLPHWPPLQRVYYMHPSLPKVSGKLAGLLARFNPTTDLDASLIEALALTLFWGGPPGRRPAFLIEGPENDREMGRGVGKTTLLDILADELAGGALDVQPTENIGDVKTRLLSGDALQRRVCRLDNLKTLRFSWADLEGLITASEISGKALYRGEGRRPNTLVWIITLNGASLSKDMAQRVIPIRLARPRYRSNWEADARDYARKHRWEILAEIGERLSSPVAAIATQTRWSTWEAEVLARVDGFTECQDIITERQGTIDDDDHERAIVADHFRDRLAGYGHKPDEAVVFIPSSVAALWLEEATREKRATSKASNYIAGLGIPELRKSSDDGSRGWRWQGEKARPKQTSVRFDTPAF